MPTPDATLVAAIRDALAAHADPGRAPKQQAYMKSALPYRGLTSTTLRTVLRPILAEHRITDRDTWEATVRALFDEAGYREERYAATTLAGHRHYRGWQDPDTLDLYQHLVSTGAWWDHVDAIAADRVGPILAAHRGTVTPLLRDWARADDLWLRRTAILAQLTHQDATDLDLLTDVIEANLDGTVYGRVFWIRKAIGWALRQYARTDPDWVRAFVAAHEDALSGLSRREALKHLT